LNRSKTKEESNVVVVSRVYEESLMRETLEGEQQCASGALCECLKINPNIPFIGTEFLLPGESKKSTPNFCVLCARKITQKLFYDVLFTGKEPPGLIQRHGNICNTPGEYALECMLVCPVNQPLHCMPVPIMSHQRNK
jgi:hypothetical protein